MPRTFCRRSLAPTVSWHFDFIYQMLIQHSFEDTLQFVLDFWLSTGTKLNRGASEKELNAFEKQNSLLLPSTFRCLYSRANGMNNHESDQYFFSLWSLDTIQEEKGCRSRESNGSALHEIDFADFLIHSHIYTFRFSQIAENGVFINSRDKQVKVADNLTHFLQLFLVNPQQLQLLDKKQSAS